MGSSLNFSYFAFSHPHNIMKRANMGRERDIFWEYVDFFILLLLHEITAQITIHIT